MLWEELNLMDTFVNVASTNGFQETKRSLEYAQNAKVHIGADQEKNKHIQRVDK